jgi:hypothetical protein
MHFAFGALDSADPFESGLQTQEDIQRAIAWHGAREPAQV